MPLTREDRDEIQRIMEEGHTASAAVPFIRRLAGADRIEDIPEAIQVASGSLEVNRTLGQRSLAARVPAIILSHYWPNRVEGGLTPIINLTLQTPDWSSGIVEAVASGDGQELRRAVVAIEEQATGRGGTRT